jgi:hypothetical protein
MLLLIGPALAGCGGASSSAAAPASSVKWPAPRDAMKLTRQAGLKPEKYEHLTYHVHAHLDVFVNGKSVMVPAGIGINIHDPGVQTAGSGVNVSYGGIQMCAHPCISPLHTHDTSGVLHTETATVTPNRLGEFFTEWGVRLTPSCVDGFCKPKTSIAIYIGGKRYTGDPRRILLSDHREIAVVVGKPPKHVPSSYSW